MLRAGSRTVGLLVVGVIILVLAIFLVITWLQGDDTNDLEERQPTPSPESSRVHLPATGPLGGSGPVRVL